MDSYITGLSKLGSILLVVFVLGLGFYIDFFEVDQRPTPRAIFCLAGAYYEQDNIKEAVYWWRVTADYNQLYGTDCKGMPEGKYIELAKYNLGRAEMELKYGKLPNIRQYSR